MKKIKLEEILYYTSYNANLIINYNNEIFKYKNVLELKDTGKGRIMLDKNIEMITTDKDGLLIYID